MIALLMVCQNFKLVFCASRKSNQFSALCAGLHFGSLSPNRGVNMVATIGSTAVKKHVCRPSRLIPSPLPQSDLHPIWICSHTMIPREKCNQSIHKEHAHSFAVLDHVLLLLSEQHSNRILLVSHICQTSYRVAGQPWAPFVSQLGMAPAGMGPLGGPGARNFDAGTIFSSPFLGLSPPFGCQKTLKCEHSNNHIITRWIDQKMHVV